MGRIPGINYSGHRACRWHQCSPELGLNIQLVRDAPAPGPFAAVQMLLRDTMAVSVPVISSGETVGQAPTGADTSSLRNNAIAMVQDAATAGVAAILIGFALVYLCCNAPSSAASTPSWRAWPGSEAA